MNKKFEPASIEAYPLGIIHGVHFSVVMSRNDGFEKHTDLPCLHLTVAADDEKMTWNVWKMTRRLRIGLVVSIVEDRIEDITKHFFGHALASENVAWRIELRSPMAARRQTVHFHVEVGHKDLFGEDGFVRQCVQSLLKPELIGKGFQRSQFATIAGPVRAQGQRLL